MCQSEARNTKVLLAANTSDVQWEIHLYIGCQKSDETGGRESKGRSGLMKLSKLFQNGKIWRSWMTDSNSVELFHVEFFLTEHQTFKVKILLFWGFVLQSDFPKSGGDPVYTGWLSLSWLCAKFKRDLDFFWRVGCLYEILIESLIENVFKFQWKLSESLTDWAFCQHVSN